MKHIQNKAVLLIAIITYIFTGCAKQETIQSVKNVETPQVKSQNIDSKTNDMRTYGSHSDDIQKILDATPIGSEIYLEDKGEGEFYLRIEKTFTAQAQEEIYTVEENQPATDNSDQENYQNNEIDESLYGEVITI